MEADVRLQLNGTGKPHTGRNQQTTATLITQLIDGLGKSFGVEGNAITYGTEIL